MIMIGDFGNGGDELLAIDCDGGSWYLVVGDWLMALGNWKLEIGTALGT
ncbi:MAG: hypothetical protein ABFC84_13800 [Veillonellales bacterium]